MKRFNDNVCHTFFQGLRHSKSLLSCVCISIEQNLQAIKAALDLACVNEEIEKAKL